MNDSLELIKSEIYEAESNLLKFTNLLKEEPKKEGYSFWITYFTNRLNILEQIKAELEAWEIVKQNFVLQWEDKDNSSGYYLKYFGNKEYETLKKALGVKDE